MARARSDVVKPEGNVAHMPPRNIPSNNDDRPPSRVERPEYAPAPARMYRTEPRPPVPAPREPVRPSPAPLPARTLSLAALRPKQTEESDSFIPPERKAPQNRLSEKRDPAKKMTELRSVLQGVLDKRGDRKEEKQQPIVAAKPLPAAFKQTQQKTGSLRPGEAIKL